MQVRRISPVPGSVGPSPPLLAPSVPAALLRQPPGYSSLVSSCAPPLREVGLAGEGAAAQPEAAVETPERQTDGENDLRMKEVRRKLFEAECFNSFFNGVHKPDSVTIATQLIHTPPPTCSCSTSVGTGAGRRTSTSLLLFFLPILTRSPILLLSPLVHLCLSASLRSCDPVSFCARRTKEVF